MERKDGVVCADMINSKRADSALYIILCVYSHKRLACVTPSTHFLITFVLMLLACYPQQTSAHFKRDECQSGTAFNTSTGAAFNMVCNVEWPGYDLQVFFCPDFFGCLDECATWNTVKPQRCVGVAWCPQKAEPVNGTSTCYLKWQMPGNGIANDAIDSGQIVGIQSVVSLRCYSNCYSKLR
jgi:hypothetical protein